MKKLYISPNNKQEINQIITLPSHLLNLILTSCECERCQLVLVLQVHQGGCVGLAQAEAGDGDQSGGPVGAAGLVAGEPGDVHRVVLLVEREFPQPSQPKLAVQ